MGILEGTVTEEAWHKVRKIVEDDKLSERGRVRATLELFTKANNKFSAKSVEIIQEGIRNMGYCRTTKDVEIMVTQLETANMTLIRITPSVVTRTGRGVETQHHTMNDRMMNDHLLRRVPQGAVWEQLKAEVVLRDSDTVLGAFNTANLKE